VNEQKINKLYYGLNVEQKVDLVKKLIESNNILLNKSEEIKKIKKSLSGEEYFLFHNKVQLYFVNLFFEQIIWKNYFIFESTEKTILAVLSHSIKELPKEAIILLNKKIGPIMFNQNYSFSQEMNLNKEILIILNKFDYEHRKSISDSVERSFNAFLEIKEISSYYGLWEKEYEQKHPIEWIQTLTKKIKMAEIIE
jgi:hypothetical protein